MATMFIKNMNPPDTLLIIANVSARPTFNLHRSITEKTQLLCDLLSCCNSMC